VKTKQYLCKNKEESVCLVGGGIEKVEVSESKQLLNSGEKLSVIFLAGVRLTV